MEKQDIIGLFNIPKIKPVNIKDERELYRLNQSKCGLKIGDLVRVKRKARSEENGWSTCWVGSMDSCVNEVYSIEDIDPRDGMFLAGTNCCFPYFVLEKVL